MSKPKIAPPLPPPQPDAPAAKVITGAEDSPVAAAKRTTAQRTSLRAQYLTAPAGVGVSL